MANNTVKVRLQSAYKTSADWDTLDPVLKNGEVGYVSSPASMYGWYKIGNGTSTWKQLPYSTYRPLNNGDFDVITVTEETVDDLMVRGAAKFADTIQGTADKALKRVFVQGTQTSATGTWTGSCAELSSLEDGQEITYWLPFAGSGSATLNLTLADGTLTGAKNCYYSGASRLTTHYAAGNAIHLTYREGVTIGSSTYTGWWADANYDSNSNTIDVLQGTYTLLRSGLKAGIKQYSLFAQDATGRYSSFTTQNGTASTKTVNREDYFDIRKIYYASTSGNYATNADMGTSIVRYAQPRVDLRYTLNISTASLHSRAPLYLRFDANSTSLGPDGHVCYKLAGTSSTDWWIQDPLITPSDWASSSNFIYVQVCSGMYDGYRGDLLLHHEYLHVFPDTSSSHLYLICKSYNDITSMYSESAEFASESGVTRQIISVGSIAHTNPQVYANAIGVSTTATADGSFSQGVQTKASGDYSHAEGVVTTASDTGAHAEGQSTKATQMFAHAEGQVTTAMGVCAHSEGYSTSAVQLGSHSEGFSTTAYGNYSHSEGIQTYAYGTGSHAEGLQTTAKGDFTHAEGYLTFATGQYSHAEGYSTSATLDYSHAEGYLTTTLSTAAHAEGYGTNAAGPYSHAEGYSTSAMSNYSHAEGQSNKALSTAAHVEGYATTATGQYSHSENYLTYASANYSHAEGYNTMAGGIASHVEGYMTSSSNYYSHAEGSSTHAYANNAHAEGDGTWVVGVNGHAEGSATTAYADSAHAEGSGSSAGAIYSHAEGYGTIAAGSQSHAEGSATYATSANAHAEGYHTTASGVDAHAEGYSTSAAGQYSHAEGQMTTASGETSHSSGRQTIANVENQTVVGKLNATVADALFIVGKGTATNARSNAMYVTTAGDAVLAGGLTINNSTTAIDIGTRLIPTPPSTDGTYTLQCVVSSGTPTYSWVALPSVTSREW